VRESAGAVFSARAMSSSPPEGWQAALRYSKGGFQAARTKNVQSVACDDLMCPNSPSRCGLRPQRSS